MTSQNLRRSAAITAALVTGAVAIGGAAGAATPQKITAAGVGKIKLGVTYKSLRERKLVRHVQRGCELGGPNTRSARLVPPLHGSVDLTMYSPRRVANITVTGGATARGVGIDDTIADIKRVFPAAKVDHGTDETFGITLVKVPRSDGGRLQFAVDTKTKKVVLIGIPRIAFCE